MSKDLSEKLALLKAGYVDIMRASVIAQDNGEPVGEVLVQVFGHSGTHAMAVAIHNERLRMLSEGLAVKMVPTDDKSFMLGFAETQKPSIE